MELLEKPVETTVAGRPGPEDDLALPVTMPRRLDFVDSLRALACLVVVADHLLSVIWNRQLGEAPAGLLRKLIFMELFGQLAVGLFIVISGFCLMLPVIRNGGELRGGPWLFFRKRARRILPPYYAAILFAVLLIPVPVTGWDIVSHLLLVHNASPTTFATVCGAFWSIGVECQIYLWFPLMVWAWRRFGTARSAVVTVLVAYLMFRATNPTRWHGLMLHFYALFSFGMLAAVIAFRPEPHWRLLRRTVPWGTMAACLAGAVVAAALILRFGGFARHLHRVFMLTGLFGMCLLIAASAPDSRLRRVLEWRPLVGIGGFSYSIYLLHGCLLPPLVVGFREYLWGPLHLSPEAAYFVLLAVGLPFILFWSYLFYWFFERPFVGSGGGRLAADERR